MRQLILPGFMLVSLLVLLAACSSGNGSSYGGAVATNTTATATTVMVVGTPMTVPPANTAVPPTQASPTQMETETDTPGVPATPAPPLTPPAGSEYHLLTNESNNSSITLKVGDTLLLELRDRQWSTPKLDNSILGVAPLNITVPQGVTAWKYKALAPGQTELTSEGQCLPNPGGASCMSILVYKVTITVVGAG